MSIRRSVSTFSAVAALLSVTAGFGGAAQASGPDDALADWRWEQTPHVTVQEGPADGGITGNSSVSSVDVAGSTQKTVFYAWSRNPDTGSANPVTGLKRSTDGGQTFPAGFAGQDSSFATTAKLQDGSLLDVAFIPLSVANSTTVNLRVKRSTNNGVSWQASPSTFTTNSGFTFFPGFDRGLRVNAGLLQDGSGNLYFSYYTRYNGDYGMRAEVAISRDNGASWQRHGPIITSSPTQQYNEVGLSWAPNGEMVAVITQDEVLPAGETARKHLKLVTARSANGSTWIGHTVLPIAFSSGYSFRPGPGGIVRYGVSPNVSLLPNGAMTLRFGRPDNWFAISTDGGRSFIQARRTYVNFPTPGYPWHGSSGNGAMALVDSDTVIVSGDNCAPSWGCSTPSEAENFTIDNKYRVWKKFITVIRPATGAKIDLLGKYDAGSIDVRTNMTKTRAATPEMGERGAIDGSTEWGASAVRPGGARGASTYTIDLDREYTLTEIGLSLRPGLTASATVEASVDGGTWERVPLNGDGFEAVESFSLSYRTVSGSGVPATAVRITVDDPNADASGAAFLNEVELYAAD